MRILLGVLAIASGTVAYLGGWATLFLLEAGGVVPFFGLPLTLPWAALLVLMLSAVSTLCLVGVMRQPRRHA